MRKAHETSIIRDLIWKLDGFTDFFADRCERERRRVCDHTGEYRTLPVIRNLDGDTGYAVRIFEQTLSREAEISPAQLRVFLSHHRIRFGENSRPRTTLRALLPC